MDQSPRPPVVNQLSLVYAAASQERQAGRYAALRDRFHSLFGKWPSIIARSPGRVNIIGEHVDYSLYSVMPMALSDEDIIIAVAPSAPSTPAAVTVANVESDRYPTRCFPLLHADRDYVEIDAGEHEWSNYFKSGVRGVLSHYRVPTDQLVGMECLVDGRVPAGAGVSSSAAFVCCSALAVSHVISTSSPGAAPLTRHQLARIAIVSERFVGVDSGGMDQSASVFGQAGSVLAIHFHPSLAVQPVRLPPVDSDLDAAVFVVAHTGVVSDKHVTAPVCYNLRVVEMRFACAILSVTCLSRGAGVCGTLREFQERLLGPCPAGDGVMFMAQLDKLQRVVEETLTCRDGYSMDQVSRLTGLSREELATRFITFPIRADVFQLYKRAIHVVTEARRVFEFQHICSQSSASAYGELGRLMNASQLSCSQNFECSCPEIDNLTAIALKNGALGSRLTGAGWGGCTVSLVRKKDLQAFLEALKRDYYSKWQKPPSSYDGLLFYSPPGQGSCLINIS